MLVNMFHIFVPVTWGRCYMAVDAQ